MMSTQVDHDRYHCTARSTQKEIPRSSTFFAVALEFEGVNGGSSKAVIAKSSGIAVSAIGPDTELASIGGPHFHAVHESL